jgi:DNA polymerase-3 subunit delta
MEAFTFLERLDRAKPQPLYVVHGDEPFLQRQVLIALRRLVLGPDDDGFGVSSHAGEKAKWAEVVDDLRTLPMLSPRRLVVVEQADPFVSEERGRLEKFVGELTPKNEVKGVLVLLVRTWAGNTKLAKMVPDPMVVACTTPKLHLLPQWCVNWSASRHGKTLTAQAAKLLVDLVGPEMGLLDQELNKLAVYVGSAPKIDGRDVDQLVGRSRDENTWEIFNLIGAGRVGDAVNFVDRLLDQGEEPIALLGAFSYRLRQLAQATRLNSQGVPLQEALTRAGVRDFPAARKEAEQQLRHLGRRRLDHLYDWLLETDQGLKGGSPLSPRLQLERLVVRLARTRG